MRLQSDPRESGAVALGMAMASFGVVLAQEGLDEACGIARDGSRLANLAGVARSHRFEVATETSLDPDGLASRQMPAVVGWRETGRYATCLGRNHGRWTLNDPAVGRVVVDEADFAAGFTGVALVLKPGPDFVREGREPSSFGSLLPLVANSRLELALLFLIGLLLLPVNLVQPNMNRLLADYFLVERYENWGPPLLAFGLLLLLLTLVGMFLWEWTTISLNLRLAVGNAGRLMRTIFTLPISFFQARLAGDLARRVDHVTTIAGFMSGNLADNALGILSLVCFGTLLVSYDAVLGLFAVALAAGVLCHLVRRNGICALKAGVAQQRHARMVGIATHGISMIETLKASGQEDGFFAEWSGLYCREQKASMELADQSLGLAASQYAVQCVGLAAVVCLGAARILDGAMTCGTYLAIQIVLGSFFAPLTKIVESFGQLQEVSACANSVLDVIRHPAAARPGNGAATEIPRGEIRKLDGSVEFRDVTFGYNRNDAPFIERLTLTVGAGERVAIVGLSGSGKSTIANLLSGLHEPWSGEVLFDGRPRRAHPPEVLRCSFAMVNQNVTLFPGTVLDNLTMYDPSVPFASVRRAAEDAMIHDAIVCRPGGYRAELDARGSGFSGGECQRIEIARTLAVEPSVLVLDEATSAIDPVVEEKIDLNLRRRGVTTIVIAHRLSTVRDADRIVVLDKGRIAEMGTHDELLKLNGIYSRLVNA